MQGRFTTTTESTPAALPKLVLVLMSIHLTAEAATMAWDDLAQRLERFIATWDSGQEPTLVDYLPAEPPAHRRMVLVELVKVDLEQRTTRGRKKPVESYSADFPELLENGEPPCDLIYEEYHIRRTAGDSVAPRDYYERFPRSADALRRLMGTEDFSATTQLGAARRIEGFAAGQKLDDFDLLVELGKGAFGSVFLARQISMQRLVALKLSADKGNEPQTLATLEHPNIIRVYDQRTLPGQRMRLLYMQFAPGGTLAEVVREVRNTAPAARTGAMLIAAVDQAVAKTGAASSENAIWKRRLSAAPWSETVCRLGIQLANALDHAHRQGVLHRDVKPANVLLSSDGSPKLADFNISFCSQLDGASPAAYFGGSLAYMSPEQIEACNPNHERQPQDLDGRSDLFALAVVLWELLYGVRPFAEDDMADGWTAMLTAMADRRHRDVPVASVGPRDAVATRLEHVLRKTLSANPSHRSADGAALARELMLCLNPRAWDLVNDLKSGWRDFARRHPLIALFPVNLPIFILAGAFNLWYNATYFVPQLRKLEGGEAIEDAFWLSTIPINGILYSLGTFLILYSAMPVARALRRLSRGEGVDPSGLVDARRRAIVLGHWVAAVGLSLWLVAGVAFPVFIHAIAKQFPVWGYLHFILSMLACGIISCCFPFLATTWLSVRVYFPALLANSAPDAAEQQRLITLGRQSGWYLFTSPVAPLMALLLVMFSESETGARPAMLILVVVAIAGFAAAYVTWQRIRMDLDALSVVARPADMIGTTTDTVETF
jgi:eukaryotic-like serine/threonine-protein kinase